MVQRICVLVAMSMLLIFPVSSMEKNKSSCFYGTPTWILENAFEGAPESAKNIVDHLRDPDFLEEEGYRAAFLVGASGVGKSTLAKAIAYKAGFDFRSMPATSFLGGQRNEVARRLQDRLGEAVSIGTNLLVVIDEVDRLLNNSESPNHDTDTSSAALWTFLDEQSGRHNFFLIGTMNRADKLPDPMKSRMIARYIELSLILDPVKKKSQFLNRLISPITKLHEEVDRKYLDDVFQNLPPCANRDLGELVLLVKDACRSENKSGKEKIICIRHIDTGLKRFAHAYEAMKVGQLRETEEERRHREILKQNADLHKQNLESQDLHFVQQQRIQMALQNNQSTHYEYTRTYPPVVISTRQQISQVGLSEATGHLTDDQNAIYKREVESSKNKAMCQEEIRRDEERREMQRQTERGCVIS